MRARIDYKQQIAHVETTDVISAGWLGFWFATEHVDLVRAGWCIYYASRGLAGELREVDVGGATSLAAAIREGPECNHSCPRHPEQEATG